MSRRPKTEIRDHILRLVSDKSLTKLTLDEIAIEVGLPGRQWVYHYLKKIKNEEKEKENTPV